MTYTLRLGTLSLQLARRNLLVGLGLMLLVLTGGLAALHMGSFPVGAADLWTALRGDMEDITRMILLDHRLPRVLVAVGAGAAFGLSGAIFQSMLRNPMASPDVIGFNSRRQLRRGAGDPAVRFSPLCAALGVDGRAADGGIGAGAGLGQAARHGSRSLSADPCGDRCQPDLGRDQ